MHYGMPNQTVILAVYGAWGRPLSGSFLDLDGYPGISVPGATGAALPFGIHWAAAR